MTHDRYCFTGLFLEEKMYFRNLFVAAASLVILTTACSKEERKGDNSLMVLEVVGNAVIQRAGQDITPKAGMLVGGKDQILTREGRLDLQTRAGALIRLKPGSEMSVSHIVGGKDTEVDLKSGSLTARMEKAGAREAFNIATPTAIAGVRGTSFQVQAAKNGVGVRVLDGRVEVKSGTGAGQKSVIADEATRVSQSNSGFTKTQSPVTSGEILEKASIVGVEEPIFDKVTSGQMSSEELQKAVATKRSEEVEKALAGLEASKPRILLLSSETELRQYYQDLDTIALKSGQKVTGAVISSDDARIVVHTPKGIVRIQRSEIQSADIHSR